MMQAIPLYFRTPIYGSYLLHSMESICRRMDLSTCDYKNLYLRYIHECFRIHQSILFLQRSLKELTGMAQIYYAPLEHNLKDCRSKN